MHGALQQSGYGNEPCILLPAQPGQRLSASGAPPYTAGGRDAPIPGGRIILDLLDMSLGNGLGRLAVPVFRIGHPGDFNDPMLAGAPAGVEMGFESAGVPRSRDGVGASPAYPAGEAACGR